MILFSDMSSTSIDLFWVKAEQIYCNPFSPIPFFLRINYFIDEVAKMNSVSSIAPLFPRVFSLKSRIYRSLLDLRYLDRKPTFLKFLDLRSSLLVPSGDYWLARLSLLLVPIISLILLFFSVSAFIIAMLTVSIALPSMLKVYREVISCI